MELPDLFNFRNHLIPCSISAALQPLVRADTPWGMSSPEPEILFDRRGAAGLVTLNRPKALNAVTLNMVRLMTAQLRDWAADPAVTRVVVSAAGGKAFSAGGDIRARREMLAGTTDDDGAHLRIGAVARDDLGVVAVERDGRGARWMGGAEPLHRRLRLAQVAEIGRLPGGPRVRRVARERQDHGHRRERGERHQHEGGAPLALRRIRQGEQVGVERVPFGRDVDGRRDGLRGVGVQVVGLGETSCGKPFGFQPVSQCGNTFSVVNFESVNAQGQGRYFDGLAATCPVAEDWKQALGQSAEPLLMAALYHADRASCPLLATAPPTSRAQRRALEPNEMPFMVR